MVKHKHQWLEIESDELGIPTKYMCVLCPIIYVIRKSRTIEDWKNEHFDTINSITNRIKENIQRISIIKLNPIGANEKIHVEHLEKEIIQLNRILNQYKVI